MELAREYGAGFLFEASVAGGIPVLHPLSRCLGANVLEEVSGILNGTTNYILTQMLENGQSYDAALREAQRLGYAEADPAADVEGLDAGRKICILAGLAFREKRRAAIGYPSKVLRKLRRSTRPLPLRAVWSFRPAGKSRAKRKRTVCLCLTAFCPRNAASRGHRRRQQCRGDLRQRGRTGPVSGPGAGRYPTASAVLGDVIELAGNPGRQRCAWSAEPARLAPLEDFKARWFVRTKERRGAVEERLGAVRWLPAQMGWQGGFTEKLPRRALSESGLRLEAVFPVREL